MRKVHVVIPCLIAFVGMALVVFAGCWFVGRTSSPGTTPQSTSQVSVAQQPAVLADADVLLLERSLNSPDKAVQARAFVPALRNSQWDASALLPDGATLAVDRTTFATDQGGIGYVNAKVDGSVTATFTLVLQLVNGQWLLASTVQK